MNTRRSVDGVFLSALGCFFLSSCAGLMYQLVWLRHFVNLFGGPIVGGFVVACLLGVAAGAAILALTVARIRRPLLVFALLQWLLVLGGLAVPRVVSAAERMRVAASGGQAAPASWEPFGVGQSPLLLALAAVSVVCACWGAAVPLLVRQVIGSEQQLGRRLGWLLASGGFGAAAAAIITGLWLIPLLGLSATLVTAAATAVAASAWGILLNFFGGPAPRPVDGEPSWQGMLSPGWVLPIMLFSGAVAMTYQIVWMRLLVHMLSSDMGALALIIATLLASFALGGVVGGTVAVSRDRAVRGFAIIQLGVAVLAVLTLYGQSEMIAVEVRRQLVTSLLDLWLKILAPAVALLPVNLLLGALVPLAVRILAPAASMAARAAGRVLAWSYMGAVAGGLLVSLVLLPRLGFVQMLLVAALTSAVLSLFACCFRSRLPIRFLATAYAASLIGLVAICLLYPPRADSILQVLVMPGVQSDADDPAAPGEALYRAVGRTAVVTVFENPSGDFSIRANGVPSGAVSSRGAWSEGGRVMGALPALSCPQARAALFLGLRGGASVAGMPPSVRSIDVIEVEPQVIEANARLSAYRYPPDPLADPRVTIVVSDPRPALAMTDKTYDLIVAQPAAPWALRTAHWYTDEFLRLVRQHINPGGAYLQWISAAQVDEELFESFAVTLLSAFDYVDLYQPTRNLFLFLASDRPLRPAKSLAPDSGISSEDRAFYRELGLSTCGDVVGMLQMDMEGLLQLRDTGLLCTADQNLLADRSRAALSDSLAPRIYEYFSPRDPLARPQTRKRLDEEMPLDWDYVVRLLNAWRFFDRAHEISRSFEQESDRALALSWSAPPEQKEELVLRSLSRDPQNQTARYALLLGHRNLVGLGRAKARIQKEVDNLEGPSTSVVRGWERESQGQWEQIAKLDAELSQVAPSDAAYAEAMRLRALWRTRVEAPPEQMRQSGDDAIKLLDRAWRMNPIVMEEGLKLRLDAARQAGRPYVQMETIRLMARALRTENVVESDRRLKETRLLFDQLAVYLEQLKQSDQMPESQWRLKTVLDLLYQKLGELNYFAGATSGG